MPNVEGGAAKPVFIKNDATEPVITQEQLANASATKSNGNPVSVDTTAGGKQIVAAGIRKGVLISNNSTQTVYLGTSGVTVANGLVLAAGAVMRDTLSGDAWYGIVASGTADVHVTIIS